MYFPFVYSRLGEKILSMSAKYLRTNKEHLIDAGIPLH